MTDSANNQEPPAAAGPLPQVGRPAVARVLFAAELTGRAVTGAAGAVARTVLARIHGSRSVFVTGEQDLTSVVIRYELTRARVAAARDLVRGALANLERAAGPRPTPPLGGRVPGLLGAVAAGGVARSALLGVDSSLATAASTALTTVAGDVTELVPRLVEVVTARRSIVSDVVVVDQGMLEAAVSGALVAGERTLRVTLDRAGLVPESSPLLDACDGLVGEIAELDAAAAAHSAAEPPSSAAADAARADANAALAAARALISELQEPSSADAGARSPLAAAVAAEALVADPPEYVLSVIPAGASVTQLVSDRSLWVRDSLHVTAGVAVRFVLLETEGSTVAAAGIRTGVAQVTGRVGSRLDLE